MIRKCGIAAGVDIDKCHPHALRHTHAVYALKAGIDLRTLQQNLGHSSIAVTAIYLTMDIEDRKEIYAAHPMPLTECSQPQESQVSLESPKEIPEIPSYEDCDRAQLDTSFTILG